MLTISDRFGTTYAVERKRLGKGATVYYALAAGQPVARCVLLESKGRVGEALVWPAHRRLGLATALYAAIEIDLGRPLRPSRIRSAAGRAFWKARKPVVAAEKEPIIP